MREIAGKSGGCALNVIINFISGMFPEYKNRKGPRMAEELDFKCPNCKYDYPNYYTGNVTGYVTITDSQGKRRTYSGWELCFDCWSIHWDLRILDNTIRADKYTKLAYLLSKGWKNKEIAKALGVHRNTVYNWKKKITQNSDFFQILVVQIGLSHVGTQRRDVYV